MVSPLARHPIKGPAEEKSRDGLHECRPSHALEATQGGEQQEERGNLDSGYAWLILLIMFLLQSSISGASRVYGIVYAKEVSIGYYDREQASWPIASASAVENLASILTPALASFLSWRQIELLSTGLFICANLLAYLSSSLALDIVALGLIQGLALSTCTVLSLVINNDYFERYRTTAYGIQMSGSTFGVLYLSPLVSWLLEEYDDFRVVYLALACVFCVNIFLVLFIKPRAKTIHVGQAHASSANSATTAKMTTTPRRAASSDTLARQASDEHQSEMERAKRFLDSLHSEQKSAVGAGNQPLEEPRERKRSRFECHFERQNSIASISYEARSRRQSVYSRQRVAVRPQQSSNSIYSVDGAFSAQPAGQWPSAAAEHKNMIVKSKSGVDLCSKLSGSAPADTAEALCGARPPDEARRKRISLSPMQSAPLIVEALHQLSARDHERKLAAKLSLTNSRAGSLDNHLPRSPLDGGTPSGSGRAETTCDLNDDDTASSSKGCQLAASNTNTSSLDVTDLESGAPEPHDLSSRAAMLLHNQQQYLAQGWQAPQRAQRQSNETRFSMERTLRLLRLPYLHCTWMMLTLYYLIARIFVIILVDFADDHGFTVAQSTHLLNYWSLGELVGRILLGPLIDLQYMSCKNCIVLTCALLAATISCMVVWESYMVYAACSTSIAALISLEYMLINVLMVEYIGKEHVTSCYPLAACISSLILFARPSLIGLFRDQLGSYDGLLMLLAALTLLLSLIFCAFEPILTRRWPKRRMDPD